MDITTNNQAAKQAEARKKALAEKKKKLFYKKIIAAVIVTALLVAGSLVYTLKFASSGVKKNQYQAVFLANGQVYFGKLSNPNSKYLTLTDVYYLQVQNSEQDEQAQDQAQQTQNGEPQLIKLGEELHGPEDEMKISKDQVTFWENLKEDSKVVKAINQYSSK
jgi:cell shape-determining protein MreC